VHAQHLLDAGVQQVHLRQVVVRQRAGRPAGGRQHGRLLRLRAGQQAGVVQQLQGGPRGGDAGRAPARLGEIGGGGGEGVGMGGGGGGG
jgi:hypothetical protein